MTERCLRVSPQAIREGVEACGAQLGAMRDVCTSAVGDKLKMLQQLSLDELEAVHVAMEVFDQPAVRMCVCVWREREREGVYGDFQAGQYQALVVVYTFCQQPPSVWKLTC